MRMKIKNCPFCGGKAEVIEATHPDGNMHYDECHVQCTECGARTREFTMNGYYGWHTEDDAITAWNRRTMPKPDKIWEDIKEGKGIPREIDESEDNMFVAIRKWP